VGEGLVQAALATIRTRSWRVVREHGEPLVALTGDQVVAFYEAVERGDSEPFRAIDPSITGMSDRRADRAVQVLKKAGLLEYKDRVWRTT